jgi:hypothetical protein
VCLCSFVVLWGRRPSRLALCRSQPNGRHRLLRKRAFSSSSLLLSSNCFRNFCFFVLKASPYYAPAVSSQPPRAPSRLGATLGLWRRVRGDLNSNTRRKSPRNSPPMVLPSGASHGAAQRILVNTIYSVLDRLMDSTFDRLSWLQPSEVGP